jgi:hypothetical protein
MPGCTDRNGGEVYTGLYLIRSRAFFPAAASPPAFFSLFLSLSCLLLLLLHSTPLCSPEIHRNPHSQLSLQRLPPALHKTRHFLSPRQVDEVTPSLIMTSPEARDAAIREAKRYIREVVRNDWVFDPGSAHPYPPPSTTERDREVVEWRLRVYDSSGSELEPEPEPEPYPGGNQSAIADDDGDVATASEIAGDRHRKRRRQMDEEMSWNTGLRTWMERRDAWAGARTRRSMLGRKKKRRGRKGKKKEGLAAAAAASASAAVVDGPVDGDKENGALESETSPSAASAAVSDAPSHDRKEEVEAVAARTEASLSLADKEGVQHDSQHTQQSQDKECDHSNADAEEKRKESSETAITEPDHDSTSSDSLAESEDDGDDFEEEEEKNELDEPLIPIVPSLISKTNPIRASITHSMYPSIYSKVVVQGLTPTVPINLADATKAMVQGWKSDGQWPPKPVNHSIVLQDDATVPKQPAAPGADGTAGGSTETKRRRSSGVANAVRKVLHFSGHPFHRRGASNENQDGAAADGRSNAAA